MARGGTHMAPPLTIMCSVLRQNAECSHELGALGGGQCAESECNESVATVREREREREEKRRETQGKNKIQAEQAFCAQ
jgi:hypothetical protein